jgi:hypothetical protein
LGLLPGGASESTIFAIIKLVQNNLVTESDQDLAEVTTAETKDAKE